MATGPRIVTSKEIVRVIEEEPEDFLNCVRETLVEYSAGLTQNPLRSWLRTDATSGLICMPAFVASKKALAVKLLSFSPGHFGGSVALFHSDGSHLCALLDAEAITEYRTAAVSVVASMIFAPNARHLGVYGAGVQARRHILMLSQHFTFEKITIWNHREESGQRLVDELNRLGLPAHWCKEPQDAAQELIVTATGSAVPVLMKNWLPSRCHINSIGAPQKDQRELDVEIMNTADLVVVDSKESALNESGDVISSGVDVTEIGAILSDKNRKQKDFNKLTVFKSLGIAVQDAATAKFVWDRL